MDTHFELTYHLDKVVHFIHLPVYWTDCNGVILGANQALLDLIDIRKLVGVRGKTPQQCFPESMRHAAQDLVRQVIATKQVQVRDDEIRDAGGATNRYISSTGSPLLGAAGAVAGIVVTTIELSAAPGGNKQQQRQSDAENLAALKNETAMSSMAHKVAHDIQSPLTALSVMLNNCDELNETKRLIFKNAFNSLRDIANNILSKYVVNERLENSDEERSLILCSDFLLKIVSERKCQYRHLAVKFEMDITPNAQFAFVCVQSSQFGRAVSNLISNAIDALKDKFGASITVRLDANAEFVTIQIKDNGKGMPAALVKRIMNRQSFTAGKENGHGIGMMQIWDMVNANEVKLNLTSQPGQGTTFELVFARSEKANWVVDEIEIRYDDIVVILDDDQIIHDAWELRLKPFMQAHPELHTRHERNGQAVIDFVASLSVENKQRVHLLCDFELLNQDMNGLQVIKACAAERMLLVTSYYYMPAVQRAASESGVKILPKQMALVTPLFCTQRYGVLRINVENIIYDKKFYDIDQLLGYYAAPDSVARLGLKKNR